jgi:flavin-dependent thymidylate synthase
MADESSSQEIQQYADEAMFEAAPMETQLPTAFLLWMTPDPLGAIAAGCRMYEGKPTYSLHDITDDERRHYWEQVQQTHLQAPLELVKFHFFIEGVDRALTHQMVRQRTAVYMQESMRFAVKNNIREETSVPPSLQANKKFSQVWGDTLNYIEATYNWLIANGMPAEDARGLLPHATLTRLNYCTDLRNLMEHAGNRLCTQAQFHWRFLFASMVKAIREYRVPTGPATAFHAAHDNDWQFRLIAGSELFRPVCYRLKRCPFLAEFDRKCSIRERVGRGAFDEIEAAEWMLDPAAAR